MNNLSSAFPPRRTISLARPSHSKTSQTMPDQPTQDQQLIESNISNSKHLFKNILKQYEKILLELDVSHNNISITTLQNILIMMNYVTKQRTVESQQLLKLLFDILKSPYFGVTLTNIMKFMLIIQKIEYYDEWLGAKLDLDIIKTDEREKPIGVFNEEGDWFLECHQRLGVRKLFESMYYNRLSRIRVKTTNDNYDRQCKFSPDILSRSKQLAEKQRNRIKSFSKKNLLESNSHEDLLIATKKIKEENIKNSSEKLKKQEMKKCPFKPKINIRKKSIDQPKDRCIYLFNKSKQSLSPTHKPSLEQKQNQSLKQCTFYPVNSSSSKIKLSCMPLAKNSHSSIQRIKKGIQIRQMNKTFQQRGYPQNVPNWTKFFHSYKKKSEYDPNKIVGQHNTSVTVKQPIMTVKVDFSGKQQNVNMYQGDSIENVACKILVKNNLPSFHLHSVEQMLYFEIEKHKKVSVCNGFISQLT